MPGYAAQQLELMVDYSLGRWAEVVRAYEEISRAAFACASFR